MYNVFIPLAHLIINNLLSLDLGIANISVAESNYTIKEI